MEGPLSPGAPNGMTPSNAFQTIDPKLVVDHLTELLQITLGATRKELEGPGCLLSKSRYADTVQRCTRFASETQVALYVQKDAIAAESTENPDENESGKLERPLVAVHTDDESSTHHTVFVHSGLGNLLLHNHSSVDSSAQTATTYRPLDTNHITDSDHQPSRISVLE
jgi:hypothetical protein